MKRTLFKQLHSAKNLHLSNGSQFQIGFTLVEMLVAVALVAILMTMFAQIFTLASGVLSQQRGLVNNDQTERQLRIILQDDLIHRTFIDVTPFKENTATARDDKRLGYFHISEGNISDGSDDILQFTVNRNVDEEPYYGNAVTLPGSNLSNDRNQPEFDDEYPTANQVGSSRYAEIAYFLRNGNLYRRVMLIREPKFNPDPGPDPTFGAGSTTILSTPYTGEFWKDFDNSAFFDTTGPGRPRFIGTAALVNDEPPSALTFGSIPISTGIPAIRWGFGIANGQPRQFVTDAASVTHYIGRFTQQETSDPAFDYPGANPGTNWYDPTVQLNYDATNGVVSDLNDGPRVAEDILLRNVHSFDIKVWDPQIGTGLDGAVGIKGFDDDGRNGPDDSIAEQGWPGSDDGEWRDLGHNDPLGFYRAAPAGGPSNLGNNNPTFGEYPVGAANGNCFDTWHPTATAGVMPGNLTPYRPVLVNLGSDGQPGAAGFDDDMNGTVDDFGELGWANTDDLLPQALRLIRIHIRYVDPKSDQMRDVVIIQSLRFE